MWIEEQPRQRGGNRATFYLKPKQDDVATATEGRPIFRMLEYVKIEVPADRTFDIDRPVREEDKANFRAQYEAFKANLDQDSAGGTLLSATGLLPPERIEELVHFKIRTVEHYAAVSDANLPRLGLHTLGERQKCRDFLEASKSKAPLLRLQAQLDSAANEKQVMQRQIADLQTAIDEMRGTKGAPAKSWGNPTEDETEVTQAEEAAPKRRGRPPKAAQPGAA